MSLTNMAVFKVVRVIQGQDIEHGKRKKYCEMHEDTSLSTVVSKHQDVLNNMRSFSTTEKLFCSCSTSYV